MGDTTADMDKKLEQKDNGTDFSKFMKMLENSKSIEELYNLGLNELSPRKGDRIFDILNSLLIFHNYTRTKRQ